MKYKTRFRERKIPNDSSHLVTTSMVDPAVIEVVDSHCDTIARVNERAGGIDLLYNPAGFRKRRTPTGETIPITLIRVKQDGLIVEIHNLDRKQIKVRFDRMK